MVVQQIYLNKKLKYIFFIILLQYIMCLTMENLPSELILIIFESILLITDKRQFLRTCNKYNILTKKSIIKCKDNYSIKYLSNTVYQNDYYKKYFSTNLDYSVEKFTLELSHDKYFDMIPEHYINKQNSILVSASARFGNKKILDKIKLLNDCYYEHQMKLDVINDAALGGQLDILVWAKRNGYKINSDAVRHAVKGSHFLIVKWLYKNNHRMLKNICSEATSYDQLPILKWAREINCNRHDTYTTVCFEAARHGHLHILKWAHKNGLPWNEQTCLFAAMNGHLQCLKYARENGCEWDKQVYLYAKGYGYIELLNWAVENGCPI